MIIKLLTSILERTAKQSLTAAENANKRAMKVFVKAKTQLDKSNEKLQAKRGATLDQLDRLDVLQDNLSLSINKQERQSKKIQDFIDA